MSKQRFQVGDKVRIWQKNQPKDLKRFCVGWIDGPMNQLHGKIGTVKIVNNRQYLNEKTGKQIEVPTYQIEKIKGERYGWWYPQHALRAVKDGEE